MIASELPLRDDYEKRVAAARRLGAELSRRIEELLGSEAIVPSVPVHYRVKSLESVIAKVNRQPGNQTLDSIRDFVGVRLVIQFLNDITPTSELILRNFNVAEHDDKSKQLHDDQFGYVSSHFVVQIFNDGADPDRPRYAEIQVRTMAQHIWATASHELQYKREKDVPAQLGRATNRLSALLEVVGAEFGRLFEDRATYIRSIVASLPDEFALNVDTLRQTLGALLPSANKAVQDDYAVLLHDLARQGIQKVGQLRLLIAQQRDNALAFDKEVAERERTRLSRHGIQIPTIDRPVAMRLELDAFATHTGLVRVMLEYQFNDHYKEKRR